MPPVAVEPVEFECTRRDGRRFVASCVITPLRMGNADHWLAVVNDVTERKRLEREIIEIANREQQRIGSDLHDGLGQDLTGIALMLRGLAAQLDKGGLPRKSDVDEVIGLVNNAIESTRTLARGFRPSVPSAAGSASRFRRSPTAGASGMEFRVRFKSECAGASARLDENAATHLYRIAQEALTNIARHSLASEVSIHLGPAQAGEGLQLSIEDNGRGFERRVADESDGLGLKIMRYRAQMLGGDLVLESPTAGGTAVRCAFPLAMKTPRRVLIVDDHPIVRQGLRRMIDLEADLSVCGEAQGEREARTAIRDLEPGRGDRRYLPGAGRWSRAGAQRPCPAPFADHPGAVDAR